MSGESPQQHTLRVWAASRPELALVVVAACHHESAFSLELDVRDQLGVSRDRLHVAFLAQVPDLHCVVVTSRSDLIPVRQELN